MGQYTDTQATVSDGSDDDKHNREIFEEARVDQILQCWTQETISFDGKFYQAPYPYDTGVTNFPARDVAARLGADGGNRRDRCRAPGLGGAGAVPKTAPAGIHRGQREHGIDRILRRTRDRAGVFFLACRCHRNGEALRSAQRQARARLRLGRASVHRTLAAFREKQGGCASDPGRAG